MFVTILTIIYLALAIFILVRFFKQSIHTGELKMKVNKIFVRKSKIDERDFSREENGLKEKNLQPEFRRS